MSQTTLNTYATPSTFTPDQPTLKSKVRAYITHCADTYSLLEDIPVESITIEINPRLKRAAGIANYNKKTGALSIQIAEGAYDSWGWGEDIEGVIRHELAHIVEYVTVGDGGHGARFKRYADALDAPLSCKQFTEYTYTLVCEECGDFVAGRYKKSKVVTQRRKYQSGCCKAPLVLD